MILVTGSSGTVGRRIIELLLARGVPVRAMTRDPERLAWATGVDVAIGDYADPSSMARAADGAEAVFAVNAVSPPSAAHDLAVLAVARDAGVRQIVRLSAVGSGSPSPAGGVVGDWHAAADEAVEASGLGWTVLRPTTFATNSLSWIAALAGDRPIMNPTGDARQGVIDPDDVAAVAVEALLSPAHLGRTYTLTGPELLSVPEQVAILGRALDRPLDTLDIEPDAFAKQLRDAGMPPESVDQTLRGVTWARAGHNALLSGDVAEVLGRPPQPFDDWVGRHLAAFDVAPPR